jgi:DNA-binding transcriptional LysR family regulator
MVPTDAGLRMLEPSASILRAAECCFPTRAVSTRAAPRQTFALPPATTWTRCSCRNSGRRSSSRRPTAIEILPLSAESDYRARLAQGDMDVVIGNWLKPPDDLHLGRLFGDEVVCLVAREHHGRAPCAKVAGMRPAGWRPSTSRPRPRTRARAA